MKTLLALCIVAAAAAPAAAGPDFSTRDPRPGRAALSDGTRALAPQDDVVFDYDSSALLESGQAQIDTAARWLRRHPGMRVVLEASADSAGDAQYNHDLATRRAQTVRDHLVYRGVRADRIVLVIFGETGARPDPEPLDRRVVLYASAMPVAAIVRASFERKHALTAAWIQNRSLYMQSRGRPAEAGRAISAQR